MSTQKYTIGVHDDVRIVMLRISRDESGPGIHVEADYLPKGTDSRDSVQAVKALTSVHQKTYIDPADTVQELPTNVVQAAATIGNYLVGKIIALEFPQEE